MHRRAAEGKGFPPTDFDWANRTSAKKKLEQSSKRCWGAVKCAGGEAGDVCEIGFIPSGVAALERTIHFFTVHATIGDWDRRGTGPTERRELSRSFM